MRVSRALDWPLLPRTIHSDDWLSLWKCLLELKRPLSLPQNKGEEWLPACNLRLPITAMAICVTWSANGEADLGNKSNTAGGVLSRRFLKTVAINLWVSKQETNGNQFQIAATLFAAQIFQIVSVHYQRGHYTPQREGAQTHSTLNYLETKTWQNDQRN